MATKKISAMTAATVAALGDLFEIVQSGVSKKLSFGDLRKDTIQTVNTATATISPAVHTVLVTYVSALCTLTLPTEANAPIGTTIKIIKANTTNFGITITPDSGSTINGAAADATITPSFFTIASGVGVADQACLFTRTASGAWRMS